MLKWAPEVWPHFLSGWVAGMVNVTATFPINKIIFRQQINSIPLTAGIKQIQREGFSMLYRGLGPPLCQKSLQVCLMYGLFETYYKMSLLENKSHTQRTLYAATLAGLSEAIVATPFERGQSLLLTPAFHGKIKNTLDLRHHLRSVRQWYSGFSAIIIRNCSTNCLFFVFRQPLRNMLPPAHSRQGRYAADFVCGAFLGAMNSTLIYPVNVVKSYQQKQLTSKRENLFSAFRSVLHERDYNIRKLYYGVQLNFTRALISWGIINATYECIMHTIQRKTCS